MKSFFIAISILMLALISRAEDLVYDFPIHNPYRATFAGVVVRPRMENRFGPVVFKTIDLSSFRQNRDSMPFLQGRAFASAQFLFRTPTAPLIFLVSGLGGSDRASSSLFMADMLNEQGYNVVILPSVMNWRSALVISSSGFPGIPQADARDYYQLMQFVVDQLRSSYSLNPSFFSLAGISYGAFQALHLADLDRDQKRFNFRRVVAINLPLDIPYGVQQIDRMADKGKLKSEEQRLFLFGFIIATSIDLSRRNLNFDQILQTKVPFSDDDYEFVIGEYLRRPVQEVAFVSQSFYDEGLWSSNYADRIKESHEISISYYMDRILPKFAEHEGFRIQAIMDSGYETTMRLLAKNTNVYVIHNLDDFISRPDQIKTLSAQLGSRAQLYPYGGHAGNIWFPANQQYLLQILNPETQP